MNHGLSQLHEYKVWCWMITRCRNPKSTMFKYYGGRGITICDAWLQFVNFYSDMGPRPSKSHTLERIDNNKGYCKANCCWATMKEQCRNRRSTKHLTFNGKTQSQRDWELDYGLPRGLISCRLRVLKWSPELAITTPPRPISK